MASCCLCTWGFCIRAGSDVGALDVGVISLTRALTIAATTSATTSAAATATIFGRCRIGFVFAGRSGVARRLRPAGRRLRARLAVAREINLELAVLQLGH